MIFDRRRLLASAAALGAGGALPRLAWAQAPIAPPKASVRPVTETLHGVTVTDPYRWMENAADPEWQPYLMGQNAYARAVLGKIPGREDLAAKIGHVSGEVAAVSAVQPAGGMIFSEIRPAGANTFKLYVRQGMHGQDRLLFDPDTLASGAVHYSLDYWSASPDGSYVALATSPAGSENSVLRFMHTATGKMLPEAIDQAQWGIGSWTPDGTGIFVTRLKPGTKHGDPDHYLDSKCWLHTLNTDPAGDKLMLAKGSDPAVAMQDIDAPVVFTQAGSDFAVAVLQTGVQNEAQFFISPLAPALAGRPSWKRICDAADDVTGAALMGPDLYLLTHKDAPRYRIVKIMSANPVFADGVHLVPEGLAVLKALATASDGVYVQSLDAGIGQVFRLKPDGSRTALKLPYPGAVSALSADPLAPGCWFVLESWVKPAVLCYAAADGTVTLTDIVPKPDVDVSPYESLEVMVRARDGVMVPLSIIYAKHAGLKSGPAPLYLEAYGAYGLDIDPAFGPRVLPWLDLGGVYAVAHVRGGGELGDGWHQDGQKLTKPNTWHDCIDCAEYLIAKGWTSRAKLAVEGTSAGGIMIGRLLTERPELLAVAVVRVGDSNALRFQFMEAGPANIPEFGSIADEVGFRGLQEMDALSHVRDGVKYPAILLTTGVNDPRVASWEPGKFTARLQAATASGKPVILRVETDAGHGIGSTRKQRDDETADTYAFILWQTGDPRFQPPAG
jgi:prolyl oligopeptidase